MHKVHNPHKYVYTTHTSTHTERASGQLAVETCQWSFGAWDGGPGPSGVDKWTMGLKGHWMGFVHLCLKTLSLCALNDEETEPVLLISFSVKATAVTQGKEQNQK